VGEAPIIMEPVDFMLEVKNRRIRRVNVLDHSGNLTGKTIRASNNQLNIKGTEYKTIYYEIVF
jgi:hypothetical protein